MNSSSDFDLEQRLLQYYLESEIGSENDAVKPGGEFTQAVIAKIRRQALVRSCVIAVAVAIGLAVAVSPFLELLAFGLAFFADLFVLSAADFDEMGWLFVAGALALLSPFALSLSER